MILFCFQVRIVKNPDGFFRLQSTVAKKHETMIGSTRRKQPGWKKHTLDEKKNSSGMKTSISLLE